MNLLIDIGNSRTKVALVKDGQLQDVLVFDRMDKHTVVQVLEMVPPVKQCILASVGKVKKGVEEILQERTSFYLRASGICPVPVENCYGTPETLGVDRLAVAVGAAYCYPGTNVLVIDAGTAITLDVVNKNNQYIGGNILPGILMRFKALHHYTNALPLIEPRNTDQLLGYNTETAIRNGIINGIRFELDGYIQAIQDQYDHVQIVFTGGDADFFAGKLKSSIFVDPNLLFTGLNRILEYNANKR
jgi:type III pantothenate kinase